MAAATRRPRDSISGCSTRLDTLYTGDRSQWVALRFGSTMRGIGRAMGMAHLSDIISSTMLCSTVHVRDDAPVDTGISAPAKHA